MHEYGRARGSARRGPCPSRSRAGRPAADPPRRRRAAATGHRSAPRPRRGRARPARHRPAGPASSAGASRATTSYVGRARAKSTISFAARRAESPGTAGQRLFGDVSGLADPGRRQLLAQRLAHPRPEPRRAERREDLSVVRRWAGPVEGGGAHTRQATAGGRVRPRLSTPHPGCDLSPRPSAPGQAAPDNRSPARRRRRARCGSTPAESAPPTPAGPSAARRCGRREWAQ